MASTVPGLFFMAKNPHLTFTGNKRPPPKGFGNQQSFVISAESEQETQAAGRVLSQKNADRLGGTVRTLIEVLSDAGILDSGDMNSLADFIRKEAGETPKEEAPEPIEAGSFKEMVDRNSWEMRLNSAMNLFRDRFTMLHEMSDSELSNFIAAGNDRNQGISTLLADFTSILNSLDKDHPGPGRYGFGMALSASSGEALQALAFDTSIQLEASNDNPNRRPIRGVLFRVDEPSEAVPAVGPGLPLYIPKSVAEDVIRAGVAGLPLDAHESLSQHANEDIAGVMQSAALNGNDFEVAGIVWPWSRQKKVQAIAKNAHRLGMSMNAMAKGHQQEVGGRRVFWVDELNLMGANILYSDKATYRKTRLLAAQGLPEEDLSIRQILLLDFPVEAEPVPIAASAQEDDDIEPELSPEETGEILEEETMSEEIKEQLQAMSRTLSDVVGTLNGTVTQLSSEIEALKTQVRDVRQDYETRQTVAAQAAEEARKQEEQQNLVQLMRAEIEAVHKRYNPSGSPTRSTHRTVPVAAGAQSPGLDGEQMQLQLQLAALDGQLTALQSNSNYDPAQVMQLLDRKRDLQVQLQGQGGY